MTERSGSLEPSKTVGDLQTPIKYLNMDEQFRMYALMQRILYPESPVQFHIYRMLKKSKRTDRAKASVLP